MRGRKPRPTAEKLAKGETRPSRVNYDEPDVPPPADIHAPKDLRGAGFRLWRDYFAPMKASGQLRSTDVPMFLEHCWTATMIEEIQQDLKKRDLDRSERDRLRRLLRAEKNGYRNEAAELGMTSVARSRVKTVTKPPVEKPKHERFFGPGLHAIRGGRS